MVNIDYERYVFRQIKQEFIRCEPFASFIERLWKQMPRCRFMENAAQRIKEQILDKCVRNELRSHAFANYIPLDQLIILGFNIEKTQEGNFTVLHQFCMRCGDKNHNSMSIICSARQSRCRSCEVFGHFPHMCLMPHSRMNARKRSHLQNEDEHLVKKPRIENAQINIALTSGSDRNRTDNIPRLISEAEKEIQHDEEIILTKGINATAKTEFDDDIRDVEPSDLPKKISAPQDSRYSIYQH